MRLSRTVAYALRATLLLAEQPSSRPVPCSRLAADGGMPERFLLQILRTLVNHGILRSTRGVDGGYALMFRPDQLSLLQVIEAVDGPLMHDYPVELKLPAPSEERICEALQEVVQTTRSRLGDIKFSALMNNGQPLEIEIDPAELGEQLADSAAPRKPR